MTIRLVDHTVGVAKPPAGTLTRIAAALEKQIAHDFAGPWNTPRPAVLVGGTPRTGIPIHLFNDPDTAGALGYHDVEDKTGLPYARVFVTPALDNGSGWTTGDYAVSTTISHEALETLGDRTANLFAPTADGSEMWAFEACDAVEAFSYPIDGVPMSDFVLPAFFTPAAPAPFDHLAKLHKHFELAAGGYTIKATVGQVGEQTARVMNGMQTLVARSAFGPPYDVEIDDAMPAWRRALKLTPGSRTTWRQIL